LNAFADSKFSFLALRNENSTLGMGMVELIPSEKLGGYLSHFIAYFRKQNGDDNEPDSIQRIGFSINSYLNSFKLQSQPTF
jgi:hypothetical protein